MAHAAAMDADHGNPQFVGGCARRNRFGVGQGGRSRAEGCGSGGQQGGSFQKFATAKNVHWQLSGLPGEWEKRQVGLRISLIGRTQGGQPCEKNN